MKTTMLLFATATLGACTDYRSMTMTVTDTPARVEGTTSGLVVPSSCPVYTPNGGDIDTPEPPFDHPFLFYCAVDAAAETYGIVTGDTGDLAIIHGSREVGLFIAWDNTVDSSVVTADALDVAGPSPVLEAWSAPFNVDNEDGHCCSEDLPSARIPIQIVAIGRPGVLISFGDFDTAATQLAIDFEVGTLFPGIRFDTTFVERFYINGPPS